MPLNPKEAPNLPIPPGSERGWAIALFEAALKKWRLYTYHRCLKNIEFHKDFHEISHAEEEAMRERCRRRLEERVRTH